MTDHTVKAREIFILLCGFMPITELDVSQVSEITTILEAERKAAVKEFLEGNRTYTSHEWVQSKENEYQARREGAAEGYRRGLEEAAEIADTCEGNCEYSDGHIEIAKRIRQRGQK